jgi:hypothetical protein
MPWQFILLIGLTGCAVKAKPNVAATCQKFGDSCEYSPGKLGTCVETTTCEGGKTCLTCQSQH